jgi:hypothetical protein
MVAAAHVCSAYLSMPNLLFRSPRTSPGDVAGRHALREQVQIFQPKSAWRCTAAFVVIDKRRLAAPGQTKGEWPDAAGARATVG